MPAHGKGSHGASGICGVILSLPTGAGRGARTAQADEPLVRAGLDERSAGTCYTGSSLHEKNVW